MYPWDADDTRQIADMIEAADGLILAAPAYHLMPPGIGTVMLNRNHCCIDVPGHRGDYSFKRRVCASIGVGGSDWTSLFMPILNFIGTEMLGSTVKDGFSEGFLQNYWFRRFRCGLRGG